MWKAKIVSVVENPTPNDTAMVDVTYYSDKGKQFTKTYNLHASNYKDAASVEEFIKGEITALEKFDITLTAIIALIDQEIDKDGVIK